MPMLFSMHFFIISDKMPTLHSLECATGPVDHSVICDERVCEVVDVCDLVRCNVYSVIAHEYMAATHKDTDVIDTHHQHHDQTLSATSSMNSDVMIWKLGFIVVLLVLK